VNPREDEECMEFFEKLPATVLLREPIRGLDTDYREGGVKVSGGEKQRLSIARLLLRRPPAGLRRGHIFLELAHRRRKSALHTGHPR